MAKVLGLYIEKHQVTQMTGGEALDELMNYPAASSGVSILDKINLNVASDGVLDPSFTIKYAEIEAAKTAQLK